MPRHLLLTLISDGYDEDLKELAELLGNAAVGEFTAQQEHIAGELGSLRARLKSASANGRDLLEVEEGELMKQCQKVRGNFDVFRNVLRVEMPTEFGAKENNMATHLYHKGFSLRQLLAFVDRHCHREGLIGFRSTTAEVVKQIIIPQTAERMCCYADVLPGGPQIPETLMSHWWGNIFLDLVKSICQHAAQKTELFAEMYTEEELKKTYWLCIFGVNQHRSICGTKFNPCACRAPKRLTGFGCQMDKFSLMMKNIPRHALALDPQLKTLTRVWVLSEINEAMGVEKDESKKTVYCGTVSAELRDNPVVHSVADAEASYPEDKMLILKQIQDSGRTTADFDARISESVLFELAVIRAFHLCKGAAAEALHKELQDRPELISTLESHGNGQTLLHAAVHHGNLEVVQLLLDLKADVQSKTDRQLWTALHFAAICHQSAQAQIISLLLASQAEPGTRNCYSRTALEEAILQGHNLASDLLQEVTAEEPSPKFAEWIKNALEDFEDDSRGFLPHPHDSDLFAHSVLRMDRTDFCVVPPYCGEVQLVTAWVKPIEWGTAAGEIITHPEAQHVVLAARRAATYLRHRWPLWAFETLVIRYTTPEPPQHYRINLKENAMMQISDSDISAYQLNMSQDWDHGILSVAGGLRSLYP